VLIEMNDEYKIWDKLQQETAKRKLNYGPVGFVQLYMNRQLVEEKFNLVVAKGREFVAQKIFNVNTFSSGVRPDWRGYTISHFGVGGGGAVADGDLFTLQGPAICDAGMYRPITLGNNAYLNDTSGYDSGETSLYRYVDAVKPITIDGSITLESVQYPEGDPTPDCTAYTKVKCQCVVPQGEPSGLQSGASVQISEAGLYFTSGQNVQMFSHICFSPKFKEKESELIIVWYILC
jgi:hypothetical protein